MVYLFGMTPKFLLCCGLETICSLKEAKRKLPWGTYGLPPKSPVIWKRLIDLSSEHLRNILKTQYQITDFYRQVIHSILNDRENGIFNGELYQKM